MGAAEELARRNEEKGQAVGAAVDGAGVTWAWPLFAAVPNRFASQVAGAAEEDDTSSCAPTGWPFELDGGPGGSDIAGALRRGIDRLADNESGSDEESSDPVFTLV